jgi:hypothetical protein
MWSSGPEISFVSLTALHTLPLHNPRRLDTDLQTIQQVRTTAAFSCNSYYGYSDIGALFCIDM